MDLLTRIEASLEFMNDGGPIRVDFVNLREVLEGSREALLKLDEYERREKLHMERIVALEQQLADITGKHDKERERLREQLDEYSDVLRGLASYVGCGGYNSYGRIAPKVAGEKIQWGIDHLLETLEQEVARLRFELDRLGAVENELRHSVSVISSVRSWLMENVRGSTHWENCEREHATCRAISQLGGVVERLSRLNLTDGVVERTVTNEETQ